jgi:major vault protein
MSTEVRQKIPVPRRSFLWSLNETSGEILMHVGPTEFTPSANDRIVRSNGRGGFEQAPMEARAFVVARDGEYVVLENPVKDGISDDAAKNGSFIAGGNKEKELVSGTKRIIPGPCSFPLWPGQSAEVRPAHKLGANQYLLVEVVGDVEERAPYYRLVIESAGLSSAVIDQGGEAESSPIVGPDSLQDRATAVLRLGQRIVIQGRHTQLFIPPSGIEIVPPVEESEPKDATEEDATLGLPPEIGAECGKLVALVREGVSQKQFSTMKSELRHRQELPLGQRAVILAALDQAFEARAVVAPAKRVDRGQRSGPTDPYARRAVVLGPKEFCILFDADGNPRIVRGPARVFPGPHDTFLQRGSRRRVYDAFELSEQQALWLRVITPITRARLLQHLPPGSSVDREDYDAGSELIVRGQPSVFFPFIETEVVNPTTREPHVGNDHDAVIINAIGIDQKKGIYVRDLRTGMVKMVRGETSYLIDPRSEEHVQRRMARDSWNLWVAHAEPHKAVKAGTGTVPSVGDPSFEDHAARHEARPDSFTTPWAVSILVPNNEACMVVSRHGRRVELGPKSILLEYEESLLPFRLSKGPSKDGHSTITTCFLRVQGARVADTFDVESSDFVKLRVKLGFSGRFEGPAEKWFQVDDPVKLLADAVRARLREAAREHSFARLVREMAKLVRQSLFGSESPDRLVFEENGMVIDSCELLKLEIVDPALAQLFTEAQRETVKLQITDEQATRRLESERHQDLVDSEEHTIVRSAVVRKAESRMIDAESDHRVDLRKLQLRFDAEDAELGRKQAQSVLQLDEEIRSADRRCEALVERRRKEAEGDATASEAVYKVEEAHLSKVTELDLARAQALAEAEALRLRAIQPELVGALHSAADAEVMKAAATNMNLVSLLGGKSPQELLENLLRGTPLERSTRDMRARSLTKNGKTDHGAPDTE